MVNLYNFTSYQWKQKANLIGLLVMDGNYVLLKKYNTPIGVVIPYSEYKEYVKMRGLEVNEVSNED